MPLNYSKWDMLELSDDSDIEEHPNVDKKSMIRWKQRDIHEKREARKLKIAKLRSELSLNGVLRPRIEAIINGVKDKGVGHYRSVQRRIKEQPSNEKPATGAANQPTYDMMLGQLLEDVWRDAAILVDGQGSSVDKNGAVVGADGKPVDAKTPLPAWAQEAAPPESKAERMAEELQKRLWWHVAELDRRDKEVQKEIEQEEQEQHKKITSDDIREGWTATSVAKPKEDPLADKAKPKAQSKEKVETIEVLNPGAASGSSSAAKNAVQPDEDEDVDFGPLTASARAFANIPIGDFERSYAFIQKDSSILTESTHDSLLAEAFDAERRGDKDLARRCVHQSLLINYCRKLGRDGVGLFFQRMIQRNPKSITMFNDDYMMTYTRIATRTQELIAEEKENEANQGDREQIQLVAQDPSMEISFNLPDGPPPADLRLEGPGTEEMDIEDVRAYLQRKWEIFQGFTEPLKAALKTEKLDEVNKVLGRMKVAEAEQVVEQMQEGGMLSFSERGVRDMTQQE